MCGIPNESASLIWDVAVLLMDKSMPHQACVAKHGRDELNIANLCKSKVEVQQNEMVANDQPKKAPVGKVPAWFLPCIRELLQESSKFITTPKKN